MAITAKAVLTLAAAWALVACSGPSEGSSTPSRPAEATQPEQGRFPRDPVAAPGVVRRASAGSSWEADVGR